MQISVITFDLDRTVNPCGYPCRSVRIVENFAENDEELALEYAVQEEQFGGDVEVVVAYT